jgi:hypothetical protein
MKTLINPNDLADGEWYQRLGVGQIAWTEALQKQPGDFWKERYLKGFVFRRCAEGATGGIDPPPNQVSAEDYLREVLRYRHGEGRYNFSGLSDYDRANASDDAWNELEQSIRVFLLEKKQPARRGGEGD